MFTQIKKLLCLGLIVGMSFGVANAAEVKKLKAGEDFEESKALKVGGKGGSEMQYDAEKTVNKGRISKIEVCSGSLLDSLRFYYGSRPAKAGKKFGGKGGRCKTWRVPEGEYITQVKVNSGSYINGLQFITNKDTESEWYGGKGGNETIVEDDSGGWLRTFGMKHGKYIDAIEFQFGYPYFISDIEYDMSKVNKKLKDTKPEEVAGQRLNNITTLVQSCMYEQTVIKRDSVAWEIGGSLTFGYEKQFAVGAPGLGLQSTAKIEATIQASRINSVENEVSTTWSVPVVVPAGGCVVATSTMKKFTFKNLPFTYQLNYYQDGNKKNIVKRETFSGEYSGVSWTDLQHDYRPCKP